MKLDVNSGVPIYLQIIEQIKNSILYGHYRGGDRIQPVRELAISLRVNPNTVAKAYRILQEEGWLESRPGGGNFIVEQTDEKVVFKREETLRDELAAVIRKAELLGVEPKQLSGILVELLNKRGEE
ncbi:MAG: GntR family transcriptional regulator [Victivallales bacterium]|nr:GntR family transcriptional regulator [Victivallales bacterium]